MLHLGMALIDPIAPVFPCRSWYKNGNGNAKQGEQGMHQGQCASQATELFPSSGEWRLSIPRRNRGGPCSRHANLHLGHQQAQFNSYLKQLTAVLLGKSRTAPPCWLWECQPRPLFALLCFWERCLKWRCRVLFQGNPSRQDLGWTLWVDPNWFLSSTFIHLVAELKRQRKAVQVAIGMLWCPFLSKRRELLAVLTLGRRGMMSPTVALPQLQLKRKQAEMAWASRKEILLNTWPQDFPC